MILPPNPSYNLIRILEWLVQLFPLLFLGFGFFPAIVVAGLIFYDASRRKLNPWIWATLALFFWIPVGIAYLIVRNAHPVQPGTAQNTITSSFKRFYFWAVSFATLMLVFWSLSSSLNILLGQVFNLEPASALYQMVTTGQKLSVNLTVLIIAFPIWAIHWIFAQEYVAKKVPEEEKYSAFSELRGYGYLTAAVNALALVAFFSKLVYFGMRYLLDVGEFQADRILSSLGTVVVALVAGIYHLQVARGASAALQGLTPPRRTSSQTSSKAERSEVERRKPSGKGFCGQCGTANPSSHKFCGNCGTKL